MSTSSLKIFNKLLDIYDKVDVLMDRFPDQKLYDKVKYQFEILLINLLKNI